MAAQSSEEHAFRELQSEQSELLDVIDQLRTQGLGRLVELPQLIVCGDQSSGKSSVLEAISRVRFPAKDGLCTRFATELILRRNPLESVKVTIEPGQSRASVEEKERLRNFSAPFSTTADLPELINAATQWMGISPTGGSNAGFSDDVLKVEISGPDKPELTLVDLPGLYHATREGQGPEGILVVRSLIEAYMKNTKSIILAVISARSNYVLQPILNLAREHDSKYERTLGIITKPDSLSPNSSEEDFYIKLANNEEIRLELGWHILRNRGSENKDSSNDARDDMEREFFSRGRWATVPREFVGVETLRPRLSSVLLSHIRGSLPKLIEEIEKKIEDYKQRLNQLGTERSNPQQQRGYLLKMSTQFERITREAINGMYLDGFFGGLYSTLPSLGGRRLRAVVRGLNEEFVVNMSLHGRRRLIIDDSSKEQTTSERPTNSTGIATQRQASSEREYITRSGLEKEITKLAPGFRGIELPGSSNPLLVGQLFRDQSKLWEKLAQDHLMTVWNAVKNFVKSLLQHLTNEHTSGLLLRNILDPALEDMKQSLLGKLEELVSHNKKRHPLPLDESFLTSIQKVQEESQMASLEKTLLEKYPDAFESNLKKKLTIEELRAAFLAARPRSDRFAAADIIYLMEAYYKVS
jgi:GTPase SAR1 family protein